MEENKKPLEFVIEKKKIDKLNYTITFFYDNYYEDDSRKHKINSISIGISLLPDGLELNKHYSIADIYGYQVVDDRKGL